FLTHLNLTVFFISSRGLLLTPLFPYTTLFRSIESTDCRSATFGSYYLVDRYSFSGVAGEEVVVQAASAEILPYLALLRPSDGAVIAYGSSGTCTAVVPCSGAVSLPEDGVYIIE